MRITFSLSLLLLSICLSAQDINLSLQSTYTFSNQSLSNIWGYAAGGKEYALVGAKNGLVVLDVTNPASPVFIKQVPGTASSWREIKTYQNYAYVVSEHDTMQVVNLSNLPNPNISWTNYTGDGAAAGMLKAHALQVDETKGFLYVYGSNLYSGKALCFNISSPGSPTYAGKFDGPGYTHDGYADNDTLYSAHIYAGVVDMVNMSNKSAPVIVGTISTPNAFPHNTWRSGAYIYTTDEKSNAYLASYKRSNFTLADKIQVTPGSGSIVHNTYIHNEYAVTSWYRDGVVIVDVSRPYNMVVVGKYDTYPCGSGTGFDGCWGVYPYLPSGNILISNILACGSSSNGEMMVFTPTYVRACYVEGRITRADNGTPITGALVQLLSTSTSESSDASGYYKMGQVESGNFTARVSKSGFVTQDIGVTLSNGVVTVLNVALQQVPAPVELSRFEARAEGRDALLAWETASEHDNSGFEVQHLAEPGAWEPAGWVPAQPNALGGARYDYRLPDLPVGMHFFRLRQMDLDGTATLSGQRGLRIAGDGLRVSLLKNPVTDGECRVGISAEQAGSLWVSLFNAYGQRVQEEQTLEVEAGDTIRSFPVGGLAPGTYRMVLRTEQGEALVLTLVL